MGGAKPFSLLGRIASGLILVSLLAVVTAAGLLYLEFKNTDNGLRQRTLHSQAQMIGRFATGIPRQAMTRLPPELEAILKESGSRFAVFDETGRLLLASEGTDKPFHPVERDTGAASEYFVLTRPAGDDLFGVTEKFDIAGTPIWVQVISRDEEVHLDTIVEEFIDHLGWIWIPFVLVLVLVNLVIIHRGLRPLRDVSASAAAIGPANASARLSTEALPREILPLVQTINMAFDRLEQGYRQQREFLIDAAHELRTPLAVLCAHLATLEDRQVAQSLEQDASAMVRLVNQLLDMARIGSLALEPTDIADLRSVAVEVATHLAPLAIARQRGIEVVGTGRTVLVAGLPDSLFRAVRNLAENALTHTRVGTTVSIAVSDAPSISVSDRGPGIPPDQREAIFERYWRGDRDRGGGIGLGLAIVARTMALHGGRITVSDNKAGGATITLSFPKRQKTPVARVGDWDGATGDEGCLREGD